MTAEILFPEICGLYGDVYNGKYMAMACPQGDFHFTPFTEEPYFAGHPVDLLYIGAMTEDTQRRVLEKLRPLKARLEELIDAGVPILATGNASELFAREIDYVTEGVKASGLGIFDVTVKTDLFRRFNGKVLGDMDGRTVVGFHSQFSFLYGDNSDSYFLKCVRGVGLNPESKLEGLRKKNLICTQLLGPLLVLNPDFCAYFLSLAGAEAQLPYPQAARAAFDQRVKEFSDPKIQFGRNR